MQQHYHAVLSAPFGALGVQLQDGRLTAIDFLPVATLVPAPDDAVTQAICARLADYLRNPHCQLDLPVLPCGTPFQQQVWQAIRAIPVGTTLTYSELAERVGSGARAVANACGANPIPLVVPCHRVVAKHGLGGFMGGRDAGPLSIKQWLLAHERGESSPAG